MTSAKGLGSVI